MSRDLTRVRSLVVASGDTSPAAVQGNVGLATLRSDLSWDLPRVSSRDLSLPG